MRSLSPSEMSLMFSFRECSDSELHRARSVVAAHAADVDDCMYLLDVLGLM